MKKLLKFLSICAVIILTAGITGYAQPGWTEYVNNPIFGEGTTPVGPKAYYCNVVYDASSFSGHGATYTYKMWYGGTIAPTSQTGLAYSNDGITWIDQGVVMANGYHAQVIYDANGFGVPVPVIYYKMWYWDPSNLYGVGAVRYTESTDGITWTNDQPAQNGAGVPFIAASGWNSGSYGPSTILYNPTASNGGTDPFDYTYAMYFIGNPAGNGMTGLAYSTDGIVWTGYDSNSDGNADPVLVGGESWASYAEGWTILMNAPNDFEMWYSGGNGASNHGIGYATSTDGLVWTKDVNNPVFHKDDGIAWRDSRSYTPSVIKDGPNYKMWFAGKDIANGDYSLGYATLSPPPPTPDITIETPTATSCGVYEFDVTVEDFNYVGAISMTLDFDDAVLQYSSVALHPSINGSFTGVVGDKFYLAGTYDPAFNVPDGTVLLTLTFNILPAGWGQTTLLSWPTTPPEANEIAGPNSFPVYIDSFFDITYVIPGQLGLTETHTDADCPCSATGSINLTINGGVLPYDISWTGPGTFTSSDEDIFNLVTGTYAVTVTDANGCTANLSVFVNFVPDGIPPVITCPADITVNSDPGVCEAVVDFMPATTRSIPPSPGNDGSSECQNLWQSFQVDVSGVLTGITVDVRTASTDWTYKLYSGIGTGGCELFSGFLATVPTGLVTLPITNDTYLEAGLDYTYAIAGTCDGAACEICVDVWGTYAGGAPVYANGYYWDNSHDVIPYCSSVPDDYHTNVICMNTTFHINQLPTGMLLSDNCAVTNLTASPVSGSTFTVGTTTVTFTASDYPGNTSNCTFDIIVIDNELPLITCATPAASYNADPGVCDYTITGAPPVFVAPKVDYFWISMGGSGSIGPGSGGIFDPLEGEDGVWYQYQDPNTSLDWWNIWFYNDPLDPDRMKIIRMGFYIQPNAPFPGLINYVVNWSTDGWTGPGFPMPPEEAFIERSPLNSMAVTGYEWVEIYFEIPDYNPEWVSVDIWGENFSIEPIPMEPPTTSPLWPWWAGEPGGIIVHECLPKAGASLDPIFFDDNCGIASVLNDWNGLSTLNGATFPVGTTKVTWTVTDLSGNIATCFYDVVVVDVEPPTIICPADVTVAMNTGCTATGVALGTPITADNCGVTPATNDAPLAFPEGLTVVTWTVLDIYGNPATCTQNVNVVRNNIAGILTYHNGGQTLGNVIITLDDGVNPPLISTTVTGTGAYVFNNLCAGTYDLSANFGAKAVGGINATDAAQANYWGVAPWTIEKVRFYAGDAVLDNFINAPDASRILQYFVTAGNPLMSPTWKFWVAGETISTNPAPNPGVLEIPSITIGGGDATINLLGQVTGDFNMSYSLATKSASETLTLNTGKNILAEVGTELELPIVAGMDMDLGAVSLILNFPADKLEINDIFLTSNPSLPLMYNIKGDELRIGWNSLNPVYLNEGESLITLYMKVIDESGVEGISLSLVADPLNELANGNFFVINDAVLIADVIHTSALGIANYTGDELSLVNHPNPFKGTTNFVYSLPVDGKVILEIYDLIGNKVMTVVDEAQTAGKYTIKLDANRLQPGVYTANLRLSNEDSKLVRTIKILSR